MEDVVTAFKAYRAIETGVVLNLQPNTHAILAALRAHIGRQRESVSESDVAHRSFLLADFHVCLIEALGNRLIIDTLRELTARSVLITSLYPSI